jgi:PTH1 family peptidyl-tRNA hydrolase
MSKGIMLIAGLGNPGRQYADTRHNAGFRFLEAVARHCGAAMKMESKFSAEAGRADIAGHTVWLLAPATYMNNSGDAVAGFARFHKIPPDSILVVHDDLDLPPGTVRFKRGGGHGGHNGLRDIERKLGSREFARLRIGIGHPGAAPLLESYVLKRASAEEQDAIDGAIDTARDELAAILRGEEQAVMNRLHARSAEG